MIRRVNEVATRIRNSKEIHIVTHIDADGIAAGAIALETLRRLDKEYSIDCVKQLDEVVINKLLSEGHEFIRY